MQKHDLQAGVLQPESGWIFPGGGQVGSMYGTSSDMNVNIFGVENCPLTDSRTRKHVLLREWNVSSGYFSVTYVNLSAENKNNSNNLEIR